MVRTCAGAALIGEARRAQRDVDAVVLAVIGAGPLELLRRAVLQARKLLR